MSVPIPSGIRAIGRTLPGVSTNASAPVSTSGIRMIGRTMPGTSTSSSGGYDVAGQLTSARDKLTGLGGEVPEKRTNVLGWLLENLPRTGYAASNALREVVDRDAGLTPGEFDPLAAWMRGFKKIEQPLGKDIMEGFGLSGDKALIGGGDPHIYNPSPAGLAGLALDIFNPGDPLNWVGFSLGNVAKKGGVTGAQALNKSFGTKGTEIAKLLGEDAAGELGARTVGKLIKQVTEKGKGIGLDEEGMGNLVNYLKEGMVESGSNPKTKLNYWQGKPITVGIQNPLTLGLKGNIAEVPIKGSEHLTSAVSKGINAAKQTRAGDTLDEMFNPKHVSKDAPQRLFVRSATKDLDKLIRQHRTGKIKLPVSTDELKPLRDDLQKISIVNVYDTNGASKGINFDLLASITGTDSSTLINMFDNLLPFTHNVGQLFNVFKKAGSDDATAFKQAFMLRGVMDKMVDAIPNQYRSVFKGTVMTPGIGVKYWDNTPADAFTEQTLRGGASPYINYVFEHKGVGIALPVNTGENFNKDMWKRLDEAMKAIDSLPSAARAKIIEDIQIAPHTLGEYGNIGNMRVKDPQGMTYHGQITLADPERMMGTLQHEAGHVLWQSNPELAQKFSEAADKEINELGKNIGVTDYSFAHIANGGGYQEDFAESLWRLINDPEGFIAEHPERARVVQEALEDGTITPEEAKAILDRSTARAKKISDAYGAERQLDQIMDKISQSAEDVLTKNGEDTIDGQVAMQQFQKDIMKVFEKSLSSAEDFTRAVKEIFKDISPEESKQIVQIASEFAGGADDLPSFYTALNDRLNPTFESRLRKVIDEKMANAMPVNDLMKMLKSNGVKDEELKWAFFDEFMHGKEKVTKADLQEWLNWNNLEIEEKILGENVGPKGVSIDINDPDLDFEILRESIGDFIENRITLQGYETVSEIFSELEDEQLVRLAGPNYMEVIQEMSSPGGYSSTAVSYARDILLDTLDNSTPVSNTMYQAYKEKGGEEYRELLFRIPSKNLAPAGAAKTGPAVWWRIDNNVTGEVKEGSSEELFSFLNELDLEEEAHWSLPERIMDRDPLKDNLDFAYSSPHFDEYSNNLLAHARFDTRTTTDGKKILFIEEIQSDWHQAGWKRGYKERMTPSEVSDASMKVRELEKSKDELFSLIDDIDEEALYYRQMGEQVPDKLTKEKLRLIRESDIIDKQIDELRSGQKRTYGAGWDEARYNELLHKTGHTEKEAEELAKLLDLKTTYPVGDAPFRNTWRPFVIKRLLKYASQEGFDGISWTTGAQQNKRWRQTKDVDAITLDMVDGEQVLISHRLNPSDGSYYQVERVVLDKDHKLKDYVTPDVLAKLVDETPREYTIKEVKPLVDNDIDIEEIDSKIAGLIYGDSEYQIVDQFGQALPWTYKKPSQAIKALEDMELMEVNRVVVNSNPGESLVWGGGGFRTTYDERIPQDFKDLLKKHKIPVEDLEVGIGVPEKFLKLDHVIYDDGGLYLPQEEIWSLFENVLDDTEPNTIADELLSMMLDESDNARYVNANDADKLVDAMYSSFDEFFSELVDDMGEEEFVPNLREEMRKAFEDAVNRKVRDPKDSIKTSKQKGVIFTPEARDFFAENPQPMFKANNAPDPDLEKVDQSLNNLSENAQNAFREFIKWRESVVKEYQKREIPINVLEKYVPFVFTRKGNADEMSALNALFGTGSMPEGDDLSSLINWLSGYDPNLKPRTTQATSPSEVNKILKKDILSENAAVIMSTRGARAIRATELYDFADTFAEKYGMTIDEMSKYGMPNGYKLYVPETTPDGRKIFKEVSSKNMIEGNEKALFLPEEMIKVYNDYANMIFGEKGTNRLLKTYDKATNYYKKLAYLWNPGHIVRDFTGNVFNGYLMGLTDPRIYKETFEYMTNPDMLVKIPGYETMKASEFMKRARENGILDIGSALTEFDNDKVVGLHRGKNVASRALQQYDWAMKQGTKVSDTYTRMAGLIYNLRQGKSWDEAAVQVKKYYFDYFELTPFERKVMKRIVPFYTWMRKNIPLQIEMLIKNPREMARISDTMNAAAGEPIEWGEQPEYIQDIGAFPVAGSNHYMAPNLPFTDLARGIPSMNTATNLLSAVSPLLRAPVELITNNQWYNGQPLEDYEGEQRDLPLAGLLRSLGIETPTVNSRGLTYFADQVPLLRNIDAITNPENPRQMEKASSFIGGPGLYKKDAVQRSAQYEELNKLRALIRALQEEQQ